jgi:hypothetical protein
MSELFLDKELRGRPLRSKWRRISTVSMEFVENDISIVRKFIRDGYRYKNGFKAIGHVAGMNGDDFVRNQISVVYFLIRVPRICK